MIAGASIHRVSLSFGVRRRALAFMLILAMLVLLAFTAAAAEAATAPTFSRTDYATGLAPTWAEPGDVNGDGRLDLVVSNGNSDTLSLLLGNGSGGFAAATSLAAGGDGPFGVAIADLTGDGRKDLAVAHRYSNTLSLLAGDGAGGFTLLDSIAVGLDPISVKVEDLNEDGKRDLLVANMESAFLTALLGDGAGGFTRRDIPLARRGATVVGIADADDDGHLDLAVGHYFHNNVSVLLGDGTGAFILSRTLTVGTYPLGTAWADVDGDGDLDLCVASRSPGVAQADQVSVFPGDGEGGLGGATDYVVGWFAKVVLPKDLNLDGIVDLTTSSYWASSLSILSGRGDGSFDAQVTRSVGTSPHAVATADLNGDGRADLVAPNYEDDTVSVLLNTTPFQQLDVTPPLTTSSADSAWHTGAVTVTLTPSDALSGVASTHFRLDGGAWQTGTLVAIAGDGVHSLEFYSTDVAGNTEATKSAQVKIDATAPTVTLTAPTAGATYVQGVAASCAWTAADPASGVATEAATIDGLPVAKGARLDTLTLGAHDFSLTVTDVAGNVRTATARFTVAVAPAAFGVIAPNGGETFQPGATVTIRWSSGAPQATGIFAVWALSEAGVYNNIATVTPDGTALYSQLWTVGVPVGRYRIRVSWGATKGTWTRTDYSDAYFTVSTVAGPDVTPPTTTSAAVGGAAGANGWWTGAVTVALSATDAGGSGVAATHYRLDGGAWQTGTSVVVAGDGVHGLEFYSTDVAGNAEATKSAQVKIDATAPTVTLTAPTAGATYVQGVAASCAWTAADPASGVATEAATIDGLPVAKGARLDTLAPGAHDFSLTVTDVAGNVRTATARFTVTAVVGPDVTAPTTSAAVSGAAGANGWWTGASLTITLTASDAQSGVAATHYRLDGGAWQTGTSFSVAGDAVHGLEFYSVDVAGNTEATQSAQVKLDAAAPLTTSSADSAWHTGAVTVTLTPSDALSGVASTHFRLDGGAWQTGTLVAIAGDGVHSLEFYSTDVAGNTEATKSAQVKIDATAPTVTLTAPTAGATYVQGVAASCAWTAADPASGVATEAATIDGLPVAKGARLDTLTLGAHDFSLTVTDVAGNVRTATARFTVAVAPAAFGVIAPNGGETFQPGATVTIRWSSGAPQATGIFAVWALSEAGVYNNIATVTPDGTALYSQLWTVGVPVGRYRIRVSWGATKGTWTRTDYSDAYFTVSTVAGPDVTPPTTTSAAVGGAAGANGWWTGAVTVALSATDAGGSGVAATRYRLDGGAWQTGTSVVVAGDGVHGLEFYSTDVAGNAEATKSAQVKIDATAPTVTLTAPTAGATYVQGVAASCAWTAADPASGVATEAATIDGLPVAKGARLDTLAPGAHDFSLTVTDVAGNVRTATARFTVTAVVGPDVTAPTTSAAVSGAAGANGWWTGASLTITLTASDAQSGVAATHYRLDGGAWQTGTSFSVAGDAVHGLEFYSVDVAGNTEATQSAQVKLDAAAPLTTSSADSAWHTGAVTVTLTPSDALSGVASTHFRLDGGAWQTGTLVAIAGDGVHSLEFYSTDVAGNTEATKSAQVKIDATAPTVTLTAPTAGATYVQGVAASCAWTAADPASGVATEAATIDGLPVAKGARLDTLTLGAHDFSLTVTDVAGNVRTATARFTVAVAPAAFGVIAPNGGETFQPGATVTIRWSSGAPQATGIFAVWALSEAGVYNNIATVTPDGTALYSQLWTVGVPVGRYRIRVSWGATKGTWTKTDYSDAYFTVSTVAGPDVTPPTTTSAAVGGAAGANGWWTGAVTVALSATDAGGSGVAATHYRLDGGAWQTGTSVVVAGDGVHGLEFYSTDVAGNAEATKSAQVKIDATAPTVTLTAPTAGATYVQGVAASCAWTAADPASGVATEAATIDGLPVAKGARLDTLAPGAHDFSLTVTDVAGNRTTRSVSFNAGPPVGALAGASDLVVVGKYAYVARGTTGLEIYDVVDPRNPRLTGTCNTSGSATDVSVKGDFAYVADGSSGMQVVDVSDPARPQIVGSVALPSAATHLTLSTGSIREDFESLSGWSTSAGTLTSDTTNVKHGSTALKVVVPTSTTAVVQRSNLGWDLSRDSNGIQLWVYLRNVGAPAGSESEPLNLRIYLSNGNDLVNAFSTGYNTTVHEGWNLMRFSPGDWQTTGSPSWSLPIRRIALSIKAPSDRSFEVCFDELRTGLTGLKSAFLWTFDDGYDENYVEVLPYLSARHASATMYVATDLVGRGGTRISLAHLQALYDAGWAVGNHTSDHTNLSAVDRATAAAKIQQGFDWLIAHGFTRAARHLAYPYNATSDSAVAAAADCGMVSARRSGKRNQQLPMDEALRISAFEFDDTLTTVAAWQTRIDRAIAAGGTIIVNGHTFDATTLPLFTGVADYLAEKGVWCPPVDEWWSTLVAQSESADAGAGQYAYVACGASGVQVVDVSDPSRPAVVGACVTGGSAGDVAAGDSLAVTVDATSGLKVIDAAQPGSPSVIGSSPATGGSLGVGMHGDVAYLAEGSSGLRIVSLATPSNPVTLASYDTLGDARDVVVWRSRAYVADGPGGISVIDVSDPAHPTLVSRHSVTGEAEGLVVFGGDVYVACGAGGLQVLPLDAQ